MAKSHFEIFNIFFIFQNKSSIRGVWGGALNLALWEMSQTAIKFCFSEPRGLFYILWYEDTEKALLLVPGGAPCSPAWAAAAPSFPRAGGYQPPRRGEGCGCFGGLAAHPLGLSLLPH